MATDLEEKDDADRYRAPALDKGLDILELLAEQKEGLTRAEITWSGSSPGNMWCARRPATVIR